MATKIQKIDSKYAVQLSLPARSTINKVLNRQKQKIDGMERISDFHDRPFELPRQLQRFYLFDSGIVDPDIMLLLGRDVMVAPPSNFWDSWLGDGTFQVCPSLFYQLYTARIPLKGCHPTCIYALLSNKRESTYQKILVFLKDRSNICVPLRLLINFQKAAIIASKKPIRKAVSADATSISAKVFSAILLILD